MGRPRPTPSLEARISAIVRRLAVVERRSRDVLTPLSLNAAATASGTSYVSQFVALVNPVGPNITWWIMVTKGTADEVRVRLVDDFGTFGNAVTATADGVYAVTLEVPEDWEVGTDRLIYLQSRVGASGSGEVLPVRALVA